MRNLRRIAFMLALCLLLHTGTLAVDSLTTGSKGLTGQRFLVLGDSYTAGYGLKDVAQDWTFLMAEEYGMIQRNYSISGSTLSAGPASYEPMVRRCLTLPTDETLDFIIVQGGSNDYFQGIPIGSPESQSPEEVCGALNRILDTLQATYPDTVIIGFTPWISDDTTNPIGRTQQEYTDAMLEVFQRRGLLCYDASNISVSGVDMLDRDFRAAYSLTPGDWYHLGVEGHKLFAPKFAEWLESAYLQAGQEEVYYDLAQVSDLTRAAASELMAEGIMFPADEHLFCPTRQATRGELALALYNLEGQPWASDWDLTDVDPASELYPAVCWCMDQGIFSPADSFSPEGTLTRQALAAVLYRYYTGYLEVFVEKAVGLGTYPDGSEAAEYARIPLGWALQERVLLAQDGMLLPTALVSRGQLAVALRNLMDLI